VTPQLASLNDDTQDAIHEMKEHFINDLGAFKQEMDSEVKKTLNEVAELREQKKQLQSDLSGLLAFKAKVNRIAATILVLDVLC
jgi:archaellum component FlaC